MMWWIVMGAWVLVVVLILSVLHKRIAEFDAAEARKEKLLELVALSDEYQTAPTDKERERIFRKAEALGFTSEPETDYRAFMDSDEGPRAA